jgi:hypothetical protein
MSWRTVGVARAGTKLNTSLDRFGGELSINSRALVSGGVSSVSSPLSDSLSASSRSSEALTFITIAHNKIINIV